jgi:hypothetical protein
MIFYQILFYVRPCWAHIKKRAMPKGQGAYAVDAVIEVTT